MGRHELTGRGAETRDLILDTALAAFAEAGFHGTSVRDIATRCGLTHPALLYHFPTKADLLMAVLARRDSAEGEQAGFAELSGEQVLDHLVATVARNQERRGVVELYATLSAEATDPRHPAHAYFQARYSHLRRAIEGAYEELGREGRLAAGVVPEVAARQVIALMDGLQIQWLLDPTLTMVAPLEALLRAHRAAD